MNKKTFALALIFLCVTLACLALAIYFYIADDGSTTIVDVIFTVVFALAAGVMVYNEFHKKKRKHIEDVERNKKP